MKIERKEVRSGPIKTEDPSGHWHDVYAYTEYIRETSLSGPGEWRKQRTRFMCGGEPVIRLADGNYKTQIQGLSLIPVPE